MSDGNLLNAALLRLRELLGHPGGDTLGMLDAACGEIARLRAEVEAMKSRETLLLSELHTRAEEAKAMREVCEAAMVWMRADGGIDSLCDDEDSLYDAARRLAAVREGRDG